MVYLEELATKNAFQVLEQKKKWITSHVDWISSD